MNLTLWDLGIWAIAFTGSWLIVPGIWEHIRTTVLDASGCRSGSASSWRASERPAPWPASASGC
jgi:hypothetical protein